jgi:hypothetical protein
MWLVLTTTPPSLLGLVLNFDTSFTGEDRLRVRLQSGDDQGLELVLWCRGGLANSAGDADGNSNNLVDLDDFYYSFPVGSRLDVIIAANSIQTDDFVTSTIVPFDGPSVADAGGPVLIRQGALAVVLCWWLQLSPSLTTLSSMLAICCEVNWFWWGQDPNAGGIFGAEANRALLLSSAI